ncbi:MAG: hypothetical protein ABWY05_02535 [Noviherbaspirillum sp.]
MLIDASIANLSAGSSLVPGPDGKGGAGGSGGPGGGAYSGYLYVLSRDGSDVHRLDIYHPEQDGAAPICTTAGINTARLTVDPWRNVYTLNYEVLRLPDGSIPATLTEPSVSLWVPLPPLS